MSEIKESITQLVGTLQYAGPGFKLGIPYLFTLRVEILAIRLRDQRKKEKHESFSYLSFNWS
jgi:hypothetical protein